MDGRTRIGIVGCGTIGSELCRAICNKFGDTAELSALSDIDNEKAGSLIKELNLNIPVCLPDEVIELSDLIIEAANPAVAKEIAIAALTQGKSVLIMSVGGLINTPEIIRLASQSNGNIHIPSGAIGGLDAVKGASEGEIKTVRLTTTKPPRTLAGSPYFAQKKGYLESIEERTVVFEGNVIEAVKGFPANINVSAALSFASLGSEKTFVRIVADPGTTKNMHEIEVEGSFGKLYTRTENEPSPVNPKTSYLAVLSAVAMLRRILYAIKVGT